VGWRLLCLEEAKAGAQPTIRDAPFDASRRKRDRWVTRPPSRAGLCGSVEDGGR